MNMMENFAVTWNTKKEIYYSLTNCLGHLMSCRLYRYKKKCHHQYLNNFKHELITQQLEGVGRIRLIS